MNRRRHPPDAIDRGGPGEDQHASGPARSATGAGRPRSPGCDEAAAAIEHRQAAGTGTGLAGRGRPRRRDQPSKIAGGPGHRSVPRAGRRSPRITVWSWPRRRRPPLTRRSGGGLADAATATSSSQHARFVGSLAELARPLSVRRRNSAPLWRSWPGHGEDFSAAFVLAPCPNSISPATTMAPTTASSKRTVSPATPSRGTIFSASCRSRAAC